MENKDEYIKTLEDTVDRLQKNLDDANNELEKYKNSDYLDETKKYTAAPLIDDKEMQKVKTAIKESIRKLQKSHDLAKRMKEKFGSVENIDDA